MYNLFLDDVRQPYEVGTYIYPVELRKMYRLSEWTIVRNYKEFVRCIEEHGIPLIVSFDHDLADIHYNSATWTEGFKYNEETGYDCAKWMIDYCNEKNIPIPKSFCHSMNPVGKERIKQILKIN